jgi:hypothetical protein
MKHNISLLLSLLTTALLCAAEPARASTPVHYECNEWPLEMSVDGAEYVVVTQLQDYLPNTYGKYQVLMSLRGDIPVGAFIRDRAPPVIKPEDGFGMSGGIAIGDYVLYMGEDYEKKGVYYEPDYFKCHGKFLLNDREKFGYDLIGYIANRLLKSKNALKINGGIQ